MMTRLRLAYSETGLIRFISHRDLLRLFFRAFSRARIPVEYSTGFNPHPRVTFCPPLKVGMEGENELLDLRLNSPADPSLVRDRLNRELPEGLRVKRVSPVPGNLPSLGKSIRIHSGRPSAV